MINGERVKQAREIRGLTQAELAHEIGIDQSRIARLEHNTADLSRHVDQIAWATGFPAPFFSRESGPEFPLGSLLYRSKTSLSKGDRSKLHQLARLAYEIAASMARRFQPLELHLQRIQAEPTAAAEVTRSVLGLSPDGPVIHLTKRLESAGIFVIALPDAVPEHDAFSLWADFDFEQRRPVIVTTAGKSGDRMRFSLAHELGHLVLHKTGFGRLSKFEDEANSFAREFLLPRSAMLNELHEPVTLGSLAELKKRWGVSIQALIMCACSLGVITPYQRKYLIKQLNRKGWAKAEPVTIPLERPRLFRQMAEMLYGVPVDAAKVAADVKAPTRLVTSILKAHEGRVGEPELRDGEAGDAREDDQAGELIRFGRA